MIKISIDAGLHRLAGIFQFRMQVTGRIVITMSGIVDGMVPNSDNHAIVHVIKDNSLVCGPNSSTIK